MDNNKTTEQLLTEIDQLRVKIAKLEKNRGFFRLIAENTSDNISITTFDLKAKYIYASPSVKSILGYDPEDLLGKSFFDFIHPEDKKALLPLLKKCISLKVKNLLTGKDLPISETIEFRFRNKAGNWRFMRSTVNIAGKQLLSVTRDVTERKQEEEVLRDREARLCEAQRLAHIGSWELDLITNTLSWSDEVYRLFDLEPQQLVATYETFLDNIHPGDREYVNKAYTDSLKNKTPYNIIHRLLLKDNTIKYVNEYCETFYNKKGDPIRSIGTVQDITERKQAEKALEEREAFNFAIFQYNPISTIIVDLEGRVTECNIKQMTSHRHPNKGDVMYKDYAGNHEVDMYAEMMECIKTGTPKEFQELKYHEKYLAVSIAPFNQGAIITSWDITERKKAEETIRESEEKYRTLYTSANDAIFLMQDYIFVTCNPKTLEMFGCVEDEIVGHSPIGFSPEHQPGGRLSSEKALEKMNACLTGEPQFFEWVHQQKDGSLFNAEISLSKMMLSDGEYIQAIVRDITKRKKAEQELIRANAEIKESEIKYKKFSDATVEGIVFHENGIVLDVNYALQKMSGYTYEEIIGKNIIQLLIVEKYHPVIAQNMAKSFTLPYEVEAIKKDGSIISVEVEGKDIRTEDGNKIIRVVAVRDITERKQAENTLKKKMNELEVFNDAAVDRELLVNDLRKEINELLEKLGIEPTYTIVE